MTSSQIVYVGSHENIHYQISGYSYLILNEYRTFSGKRFKLGKHTRDGAELRAIEQVLLDIQGDLTIIVSLPRIIEWINELYPKWEQQGFRRAGCQKKHGKHLVDAELHKRVNSLIRERQITFVTASTKEQQECIEWTKHHAFLAQCHGEDSFSGRLIQ